MSDQENNTEQPTEKRLEEARARGQIARAPELQVVAGLLATFSVILFSGKSTALRVAELWAGMFGHLHELEVSSERIGDWTRISMMTILSLALPVLIVSALASVLVGLLQTRFALTPKALEVKWSRLDPVQGLQRIFSKEGAVRLLVDTLKLGIVGALLYSGVQRIINDPIFSSEVQAHQLGLFIYDTTLLLLFRLSLALGGIAAINYLYQVFKVNNDLMMSKQEVKEEMRSAEGDPVIRAMRRQMSRRLLQKQMLAAIPTADVVITNPTHFAIALKYERGVDQAPIVLAKGENAFAKRIKAIAAAHDVPMVENRPVARMLFRFGKVGETIPAQLYHVVAEILGFVYRTHRLYFHDLKQRRLAA
ncbi:MAG: flagellar biosynthesis protein FlhB [Chthoniobacter sp.]|jgi:flagellar biosynthetic protein FlhB|nr:flagellar biosynthesis protein FlhB [Chthoniobacter sp.]